MENYSFIDSKFRLVILAAKRAKQLINGAKKKLDIKTENPLTLAIKEIYAGKIDFEILEAETTENTEDIVEEPIDTHDAEEEEIEEE